MHGLASQSRVEACQAVIRMLEGQSGSINRNGISHLTPSTNSPDSSLKPTDLLQLPEYGTGPTGYSPDLGYDSTHNFLDSYDGNSALPFSTRDTHGKYKAVMADTTPHVMLTGLPVTGWYSETDAAYNVHGSVQGPSTVPPGLGTSSMSSVQPIPGVIGAGATPSPWDLFLSGFSVGKPSRSSSPPQFG